ncbi:hypothetical protein Hypma_004221 [Hypsizygus marmoreus]|uniref:Protein kinase domain-containing protein n=1 Tax=Hypsizygus marmoreus TaxID=39966 RepID=A0A369J4D4_HYPMA|nr:hypothetical protein Hypma_004221 [Hypsizygus marmoreus]
MVVLTESTSTSTPTHSPISQSFHTDLTSVSSVTIQGMVSSRSNPVDVTLTRAESFPGCRYSELMTDIPPIPGWAAAHPPKDQCNISLRLGERISDGRIGLVYSVDVLGITHAPGENMDVDLPPQLCIKVAKERHSRSLAREAWFYEQLAFSGECAGMVTPRCFGFFTVRLRECFDLAGNSVTRVEPWSQAKPEATTPNNTLLHDDMDYDSFRDEQSARDKSPWNKLEASWAEPLLCLLLLERLGPPFTNVPRNTVSEDEYMQELRDMIYDIGYAGVFHGDFRYTNILRAPDEDSSPLCPRHRCRHRWRIIDFDRAYKLHFTETDSSSAYDFEKATVLQARAAIQNPYFWGCP